MEKPLIPDDDEINVKEFDLGTVKGIYVVLKHIKNDSKDIKEPDKHKNESESESGSDSE